MFKSLAAPAALIGGVIGIVAAFIAIMLVAFGLMFLKPYAPELVHAFWGILGFQILGQPLTIITLFLTGSGCAVYVFGHWPRQNDAHNLRLAAQWIKDHKWSYVGYSFVAAFFLIGLVANAKIPLIESMVENHDWKLLGLVVFFVAAPFIFYPFAFLLRAIFYGLEDIIPALGGSAPRERPTLRPTLRLGAGDVYRGVFAVFDLSKNGLTRLANLIGGLLSAGIGGALLWWSWNLPPFEWNNHRPSLAGMFGFLWPLWLIVGALLLLQGIGFLFEAVRFSLKPKTASVHGSARPAEEREAQAAARGETKAPTPHDQRFSD